LEENILIIKTFGPFVLLSKKIFVGFHPTFSRHGKVEASFTLLIWLNENVLMLFCLKRSFVYDPFAKPMVLGSKTYGFRRQNLWF